MTPGEWLRAHADGVPPALAERVQEAVRSAAPLHGRNDDVSDHLLLAGADVLNGVLAASPMTRAHALHLLGADALVTYAFEAAAADPAQYGVRADEAMRRIAALGGARGGTNA